MGRPFVNVRVLENKLQGPSLFSIPTLQAALSDLPENEAAPALLEFAENAEQKRRGLIKNAIVLIVLIFLIFSFRLAITFSPLRRQMSWQIMGALLTATPLLALAFAEYFCSPQKALQTKQNAVAALLLCPWEPRFLPQLVDSLRTAKTPEWKTMLYPALTAALWDASSDDLALRLDAPRRAALRAFVAYDFPITPFPRSKTQVSPHFDDATTDLTVAAMRTLASLGDKKTVNVLQRIIKAEGNTRNEAVVRDAAREFLPVLQKRIAENEAIFRRLRTLASDQTENPDAAIAIQLYADTLPHETAPVVLAEYLMEQKQSAAQERVWAGVGLAAVCGAEVLMYFLLRTRIDGGMVIFLGFVLSVVASLCTSTLRRPIGEMQARKIAYELAKRCGDDTRLLPLLLHALHTIVDKKQKEMIEKSILHLLPLLRTGDAALVPPHLRRPVRAWLTMPRGVLGKAEKNGAIIALNALAALGDTESLRRVLAVERYGGKAKHGDPLRQTAARCADALRLRKPLA